MTRWRVEDDLTGLHAPSELAKLPADERRDCPTLWVEVDHLLHRSGGVALQPQP